MFGSHCLLWFYHCHDRVYESRCTLYFNAGLHKETIDVGKECLEMLQLPLPKTATMDHVSDS